MKYIITPYQHNEIYSDKCGVLVSGKARDEIKHFIDKVKNLEEENAKLSFNTNFLNLIDYLADIVENEKDFFSLGDKMHSAYYENISLIENARKILKELEE